MPGSLFAFGCKEGVYFVRHFEYEYEESSVKKIIGIGIASTSLPETQQLPRGFFAILSIEIFQFPCHFQYLNL